MRVNTPSTCTQILSIEKECATTAFQAPPFQPIINVCLLCGMKLQMFSEVSYGHFRAWHRAGGENNVGRWPHTIVSFSDLTRMSSAEPQPNRQVVEDTEMHFKQKKALYAYTSMVGVESHVLLSFLLICFSPWMFYYNWCVHFLYLCPGVLQWT